MSTTNKALVDRFVSGLERRNPHEPEFLQAVREFATHVMPLVRDREDLRRAEILERMTEPDRIVIFRVTWQDDDGGIRADRAWRVQFNNSLGPYKGGLRFGTETTLSVLKFLGFEQTFKNALTGLPMGGAKGGSNFNPKGKSDAEVMRFCQSLMIELHRHIGEDVDIPAGDIGVGEREIAWLFGQYKRIRNRFGGVLTGKGLTFGGSAVRTEATGYGAVYFAQRMLDHAGDDLQGKTCAVSGSGNVSIYCVEKLIELGARVVTLSDSGGTVHDPDGVDEEKLQLRQRAQARTPRAHQRVRRPVRLRVPEGRPAVGRGVRPGLSLRHPERARRARRPQAGEERVPGGGRGGEHAGHLGGGGGAA